MTFSDSLDLSFKGLTLTPQPAVADATEHLLPGLLRMILLDRGRG